MSQFFSDTGASSHVFLAHLTQLFSQHTWTQPPDGREQPSSEMALSILPALSRKSWLLKGHTVSEERADFKTSSSWLLKGPVSTALH
jgi:hypothetical protein